MSFYGKITNTEKSPFSFDRIYSSRRAMELAMSQDDVYAGKFVLVEYDKSFSNANFYRAYRDTAIDKRETTKLYKDINLQIPITHKENLGDYTNAETGVIFYVIESLNEITYYVKEFEARNLAQNSDVLDSKFYTIINDEICYVNIDLCPDLNITLSTHKDEDNNITVPIYNILDTGQYSYYQCTGFDTNTIVGSSDEDTAEAIFQYLAITESNNIKEGTIENYLTNAKIDSLYYRGERAEGYDSTVWQKIYIDNTEKYIMVADLNTKMPLIKLSADAPTMSPKAPHFDTSSTSAVYDLHQQPQWGFRIKSANALLTTTGMYYNADEQSYIDVPTYTKEIIDTVINSTIDENNKLITYISATMDPDVETFKDNYCITFSEWCGVTDTDQGTVDDQIFEKISDIAEDVINKENEFSTAPAAPPAEETIEIDPSSDIIETPQEGEPEQVDPSAENVASTEEEDIEQQNEIIFNLLKTFITTSNTFTLTNEALTEQGGIDNIVTFLLEGTRNYIEILNNYIVEYKVQQQNITDICNNNTLLLQNFIHDALILNKSKCNDIVQSSIQEVVDTLNIISLENYRSDLFTDDQLTSLKNRAFTQIFNVYKLNILSDEQTQWEAWDDDNQQIYYYDETQANWTANNGATLAADIYFNRDGFNEVYDIKASDDIEDEITITPTGISQTLKNNVWKNKTYNDENSILYGETLEAPDTQELSIHLPSIGNTISKVWDLTYGPGDSNLENRRNTDIQWNSLKGIRMVKPSLNGNGYTYDIDDSTIGTIAGVINSVHDLMGQIIIDEADETLGVNDFATMIPSLRNAIDQLQINTYTDINNPTPEEEALFLVGKNRLLSRYIDDHYNNNFIYYFIKDGKYYRKNWRYNFDADYTLLQNNNGDDAIISTQNDYINKVQGFTEVALADPSNVNTNLYYESDGSFYYSPDYNKNYKYYTFNNVQETPFALGVNEYRYDGSGNFIKDDVYSWQPDKHYDLSQVIEGPFYAFIPNKFYKLVLDDEETHTQKYTKAVFYEPETTYYLIPKENQNTLIIEDTNETTTYGEVAPRIIPISSDSIINPATDDCYVEMVTNRENYSFYNHTIVVGSDSIPITYDLLYNIILDTPLTNGLYAFNGYAKIVGLTDKNTDPNNDVQEPPMFYRIKPEYVDYEVEKYIPGKYHYKEENAYGTYNYILDSSLNGTDDKRDSYVLLDIRDGYDVEYYEPNQYYVLDHNVELGYDNYLLSTEYDPNQTYYSHDNYYVTQNYMGHTQGEIWDKTINWSGYALANEDNFDYGEAGYYFADQFGDTKIKAFYEPDRYWIETHYKLNSSPYDSNLDYWADRYGDQLLDFYKPNKYYILDTRANYEYHDLAVENAVVPERVYYFNKACSNDMIVHFWEQNGYNNKQYYKKNITYPQITSSDIYNSNAQYYIDIRDDGVLTPIKFDTYSANKYWYRTVPIDRYITQTTSSSTYAVPDDSYSSNNPNYQNNIIPFYYDDKACTERVYFVNDIDAQGHITNTNYQLYTYTAAGISYQQEDNNSIFDPGQTYYEYNSANQTYIIKQNLYAYEPSKFYYQTSTSVPTTTTVYTVDTELNATSNRQYYLDTEGEIPITLYVANNNYIYYDEDLQEYVYASQEPFYPEKTYYNYSLDGNNKPQPTNQIWNLYQYESNKFYYATSSSTNITVTTYALDTNNSPLNTTHYLDGDGQIPVTLYTSGVYYIKVQVPESYTAVTTYNNTAGTYYIDPEIDGSYKEIEVKQFNGSQGYYYLTQYQNDDVIKDSSSTFGTDKIYYYDEACTIRAYFPQDFDNTNGKIRNTDIKLHKEVVTYPAVAQNEQYDRTVQYYLSNNDTQPINIDLYNINEYYFKHNANANECTGANNTTLLYPHYILCTEAQLDNNKVYYKTVQNADMNYNGDIWYKSPFNIVAFSNNDINQCYIYDSEPCYRRYDSGDEARYNGFNHGLTYYTDRTRTIESNNKPLLSYEYKYNDNVTFIDSSVQDKGLAPIILTEYTPYVYYHYDYGYNEDLIKGVHLVNEEFLEKEYFLEELKGFSKDYNTIHGLILQFNRLLNTGSPQSRDINTIQGALNRLQDEIKRLGAYDFSRLNHMSELVETMIVRAQDLKNEINDLLRRIEQIETNEFGFLTATTGMPRTEINSKLNTINTKISNLNSIVTGGYDYNNSHSVRYRLNTFDTNYKNLLKNINAVINHNNDKIDEVFNNMDNHNKGAIKRQLWSIKTDGSINKNSYILQASRHLTDKNFTAKYESLLKDMLSPKKPGFTVYHYTKTHKGKKYTGFHRGLVNNSFVWKDLQLAYIDITMGWHLPNHKTISPGDWFKVGTITGFSPLGNSAIACEINGLSNDTNRLMTCQIRDLGFKNGKPRGGELWCRCSHNIYPDNHKGVDGYYIQINGFVRTNATFTI